MTVLLNDDTVRHLLDPLRLVEEIEHAVRGETARPSVVPERLNLAAGGRFLRVMPAVVPGSGVMGLKTFFGGGPAGVRYVVLLISIESGEVLSVLDACYLTAARTAATSAVAARALGVKAETLGVLGSGLEAEAHVRTFAAIDDVRKVCVFSPNPETRRRFADRMAAELGIEVVPVGSAAEACADVEHLITATNTGYGGPTACESAWIPAGVHLTAIGSTHQDLRELETAVLRRADVLVFDAEPEQIAGESGDVRAFVGEGGRLDHVFQLDALLQGRADLPVEPRELTIFKSVGTALQDMVAADLAYRLACEAGAGEHRNPIALPKSRR